MKEFSKLTGLSRPTVSKYFNDPTSVRASTRARIEEALEKYDYRPNFFAVNQNRRNPKTLGIVVPQFTDPFFAEMVGLFERKAMDAGYFSITLSSHGSPEHEVRAIEMIRSLNLGGVILAPLGCGSDVEAIQRLQEEAPLLLFDSLVPGLEAPALGCDNAQGIGLMVDYLCETGTAPCYVDMPEVNSTAGERRAAYIAAMEARGFEPMVLSGPETSWQLEAIGTAITHAAFEEGGFPSSTILCANDRLALGVLSAVQRAGMSIGPGGEVRLAGHDDHPACVLTVPSLTTVAQDKDALAKRALEITLAMISTGEPPDEIEHIPSRLVLRESA